MPGDEGLGGAVGRARILEENYDWLGAIELRRGVLDLVSKTDFLTMGQIQERIGYDFYRAGMQAESVEEFRDRMRQVVGDYEGAKEFYGKIGGQKQKPRTIRCDAMIAYVGYWLASDMSEKKRLLEECWKLTKESLGVFQEIGDQLEYGITYNQLSNSPVLGFCFEWDFQTREKLMREAVEHGEQAIKSLTSSKDPFELARAYAKTAFCSGVFDYYFLEISERVKGSQRVQDYWRKAKKLSEEIALLEMLPPVFGGLYLLWGDASDEAFKNLKKALECGRKTRDKFIIGCALDWLTYHSGWSRYKFEDPEKRSRVYKATLRYAEDAMQQYAPISFMSPRADSFWAEWVHIEYYWWLANNETDLGRKLRLLEKAREVAADGLKRAESSEYPDVIAYVNHIFSQTLVSLALMQKNPIEKTRLLEEALEHRKKAIRIVEQLGRFHYWNRGMQLANLATIKYQLADLTKDPETKKRMIRKSLVDSEKSMELAIKEIYHGKTRVQGYFRNLGILQYNSGVWLNHLYELTDDKEHLRKAAKFFAEAAESNRHIRFQNRVAECHWKAAQTYDALDEHLQAAENFGLASENYRFAAEKIPLLIGFYSDYSLYMRAWAEIERSRHEHENEDYGRSRDHYRMCSRLLEITEKWSYQFPYYFAWSLLEHGEALSRLDKLQDAMKVFKRASRSFGDSSDILRRTAEEFENSEEKEEAFKLADIARLRKQYCMGKALMEEAKLSNRKGDRISSATKFAYAARIFKEIAPNLEREEARRDLQFAATTCQAWEKMELAEERGDATLYKKAAELFAKASKISHRKTAELTAEGNSCFCEALELGMKFMATSNRAFYSGVKLRMENAAGYYLRAGLEKPALWVEAAKKLFDAYVYVGNAEAEAEPEKRVRFYSMAERCLELSAKFYGQAGYREKKNEVLQSLERARKQRELAFSLNEVLTVPSVLSSTTGVSMPDSTEKAAGLNGFESVNVRARLSVPKEFVPGEEFQVELDLVNVGREPGLLVRIEGLIPPRSKVLRMPSYCALEGGSLNMRGKRLDPLSVESISIWVQIADVVSVSLSPLVVYVDELGNFRTTRIKETKILPVVEFQSKVAQVVFNCLVNAFVEDCVKRRLSPEKSGWRSFPQIVEEAGVSKRSLYGTGGRLGYGLSELQKKGLVDLQTFLGERGRGGHILRVRIHYERDLVRRYLKEKAPDLLT